MPYSERQVADKITRTTEAWEEHAEDAKFAEMTLDQFKAKVKPSLDCRKKIASLRRQLEAAIKKRRECDAASTDICAQVVNAVGGATSNTARTARSSRRWVTCRRANARAVCAAWLPSRRRPELRRPLSLQSL
jgi:hypothetical protein